MAYEQKPGDFTLFKNDKGDNPKRPDYTGNGLDLAGKRIKVSAWIKQGGKGKFMSCRFQEMTAGEPAMTKAAGPAPKESSTTLRKIFPSLPAGWRMT
jgi:hypothetical protein